MFPYYSRIKGTTAFKLKKATAPDPWRAELVDSAIELKRLHGPGCPTSDDGELLVLNDGVDIGEAEEGEDAANIVDGLFDEMEAEYGSEESDLEQ